jgi:hypothetical protein
MAEAPSHLLLILRSVSAFSTENKRNKTHYSFLTDNKYWSI